MYTFRVGIDRPQDAINLVQVHDYYKVKSGFSSGNFTTPAYNGVLNIGFEGFDVIPREDIDRISLATIKPGIAGYWHRAGNTWVATSTPVYQSIEVVRDGLPDWCNSSIQFNVKLTGSAAKFRELAIGYNVPVDVFSYLVNFRISSLLSTPFSYSVVTKSDGTGKVLLPSTFSNITVTGLNIIGTGSAVVYTQSGQVLTTSILNQPMILTFDCTPSVFLIDTELVHQIGALPEVILEVKEESKVRKPFRADYLERQGDSGIIDSLVYVSDLNLAVSVVASSLVEARAIARILIANIQSTAKIFSPADGLEYGLYVNGGIQNKASVGALSNNVMVGFNLKIFNYSVTQKSYENLNPRTVFPG